MKKFFIFAVICVLLIFNATLIGWHKGYKAGYDAGIVDVYLNLVNPEKYILKKEKVNPTPPRNKKEKKWTI